MPFTRYIETGTFSRRNAFKKGSCKDWALAIVDSIIVIIVKHQKVFLHSKRLRKIVKRYHISTPYHAQNSIHALLVNLYHCQTRYHHSGHVARLIDASPSAVWRWWLFQSRWLHHTHHKGTTRPADSLQL